MTTALTFIEKQFLELLDRQQDWVSRQQISEQISQPRLSSYQTIKLDGLYDKGLIERKEDIIGFAKKRFMYRKKAGASESDDQA